MGREKRIRRWTKSNSDASSLFARSLIVLSPSEVLVSSDPSQNENRRYYSHRNWHGYPRSTCHEIRRGSKPRGGPHGCQKKGETRVFVPVSRPFPFRNGCKREAAPHNDSTQKQTEQCAESGKGSRGEKGRDQRAGTTLPPSFGHGAARPRPISPSPTRLLAILPRRLTITSSTRRCTTRPV